MADVDGDGHAEILWIANGVDPTSAGWGCDVAPWNKADAKTGRQRGSNLRMARLTEVFERQMG